MRAGLCRYLSQYLILRWVKREDLPVGTSDSSLKFVFDSIPAFDESSKKMIGPNDVASGAAHIKLHGMTNDD